MSAECPSKDPSTSLGKGGPIPDGLSHNYEAEPHIKSSRPDELTTEGYRGGPKEGPEGSCGPWRDEIGEGSKGLVHPDSPYGQDAAETYDVLGEELANGIFGRSPGYLPFSNWNNNYDQDYLENNLNRISASVGKLKQRLSALEKKVAHLTKRQNDKTAGDKPASAIPRAPASPSNCCAGTSEPPGTSGHPETSARPETNLNTPEEKKLPAAELEQPAGTTSSVIVTTARVRVEVTEH